LEAVLNEVGDRTDLEVVALGERDKIVEVGDLALVVQNFDDNAGGFETGELGEVDAGLGVTGADEDAAGLSFERADMAGAAEIGGLGVGVEAAADGWCGSDRRRRRRWSRQVRGRRRWRR
jgi:hypothetical protein